VRVRGVVANDEIGLPSDAVTVLVSEGLRRSRFSVQSSAFDVRCSAPARNGASRRGTL